MSEHYVLHVFAHQNANDQLASEIAALSGCDAVTAKVALGEGGTLGSVLSQSKAQQLAHTLGLLGVTVEVRAALYKPTLPESFAPPHKRVVQAAQVVPSRKPKSPFIFLAAGVILCLAILGWSPWRAQPSSPPGILAPDEPIQSEAKEKPWQHGEYLITPLASYDVTARVLSRKNYTWDRGADLSPVDFALGWGVMSDANVLADLRISQSGRWFYVYWSQTTADSSQFMTHSANTHILPSSPNIKRAIKAVKRNDIVRLTGYLVEVTKPDGYSWRSSLARGDTGNGSCEVLWVTGIEVIPVTQLQAKR